jgi:hypothetical protein
LFHFGRLILNLFFNSLLYDLLLPVVVAFAAQALFHASCCASPGLVSCQLLRKPWPCFTPVVAQALALFHASCCASPGLVSLARCRGFAARALLLAAYALGVAFAPLLFHRAYLAGRRTHSLKGGGSGYLVLAAQVLAVLAAGNITGISGRRYYSVVYH